MSLGFKKYKNVVFDFDGVIVDSNKIKEVAIEAATGCFVHDKTRLSKFVEFFVENNGIPREEKIFSYFKDDKLAKKILDKYNEILKRHLPNAKMIKGLLDFLQIIRYYDLNAIILSGGDKDEIKQVVKRLGLHEYFKKILCGPLRKSKNLNNLKLKGESLYIGDSKIDHEIALEFNFDFVFMYGHTQFNDWRRYFDEKNNVIIEKDFVSLTKKISLGGKK